MACGFWPLLYYLWLRIMRRVFAVANFSLLFKHLLLSLESFAVEIASADASGYCRYRVDDGYGRRRERADLTIKEELAREGS